MNVLAYGGGTDSTAIICGWIEKGYQAIDPIDLILFADTGDGKLRPGERPHTYDYIEMMQEWLPKHGMPQITIVRKGGNGRTLYEDCRAKNMLPSLAYGKKGCSHKFKIEPQEKFLNNHPQAKAWWNAKRRREPIPEQFTPAGKPRTRQVFDRKVHKLVGYEFAETHRWLKAKIEDEKYSYEYPLVEWEWSRAECVTAIKRMGLPLPQKSSCFFCPSSTKPEIEALGAGYPHLLDLALEMELEAAASLKSTFGLGRRFSWNEHVTGRPLPRVIPINPEQILRADPCMVCVDN